MALVHIIQTNPLIDKCEHQILEGTGTDGVMQGNFVIQVWPENLPL